MARSLATSRSLASGRELAVSRSLASGRTLVDGGSSFLLRDTFTDADGTALTAHTMDVGGGWTVHTGTLEINNNQLREISGIPVISAGAGQADVTVRVKIYPDANNAYFGMAARLTDASNFWLLAIAPISNIFAIVEINAGVFTVRASSAFTPIIGAEHRIVGTFSGTTITSTMNEGNDISYGSATFNQTATRCGLRTDASVATNVADDFEVTA